MSNRAKQRPPAVPTLRPAMNEQETGRFRIGQVPGAAGSTIVPPSGGVELAEVSLDSLGAILELDGADAADRLAENEDALGNLSGDYPTAESHAGNAGLDELGEIIGSSRPYYEQREAPVERAQLEFEDLSLRLDSRYVASSLVPPPRKSVPVGKLLALAGAAATAVGAALLLWSQPSAAVSAPTALSKQSLAPQASEQPVSQISLAPPVAAVAVEVPADVRPTPDVQANLAAASEVPAPAVAVEATKAAPLAHPVPARSFRASVTDRAAHSEQPADGTPSAVDSAGSSLPVAAPTAEGAAVVVAAPAAIADVAVAAPTVEAAPAAPAAVESGEVANLPELPTREAVTLGFEKIRDQISSCAAGKHGIVTLNATIVGAGRLSGVLVDGVFKGTPEGSCMARAARAASFPPFSQSTLKVSYPISI